MKKSVINKNITTILAKYSSNAGYISIADIYNGNIDDVISGKFTNDVIYFCDSNCSNGYFSRWTNFGVDLVNDSISFTKEIIDLQKS